MAELYVINTNNTNNPGSNHEVHKTSCKYKPSSISCRVLGFFSDPKDAVNEGKKYYTNADGCYWCCREAHRG